MVNCPATAAKEGDCLASPAKDDDCPATAGNCLATGAKDSGCPATAAKESREYMDGDGWSFGVFWVLLSKDSCSTKNEGLNSNGNCDELDGNGEIDCNLDCNGGLNSNSNGNELDGDGGIDGNGDRDRGLDGNGNGDSK